METSAVSPPRAGVTEGGKLTFSLRDDPNDPGIDGNADDYGSFTIIDGGDGDLDGEATARS